MSSPDHNTDRTMPNDFIRVSATMFDSPKLADLFDEHGPHVYVVWLYLLCRSKTAKKLGRIIINPVRVARATGLTQQEASNILDGLVRVRSIVPVGDQDNHYEIRNWGKWQSMAPSERSLKQRQKAAESVMGETESVTDDAETQNTDPPQSQSPTQSPTQSHNNRAAKNGGPPSSSNQPEQESTTERSRRDDIRAVFEHWKQLEESTMGRSRAGDPLPGLRNPRQTKARTDHINARLDEGNSVEDLCNAITAYLATAFYLGDNDRNTRYTDLTTIIKNTANAERGIAMYGAMQAARPKRGGSLVRPQA